LIAWAFSFFVLAGGFREPLGCPGFRRASQGDSAAYYRELMGSLDAENRRYMVDRHGLF